MGYRPTGSCFPGVRNLTPVPSPIALPPTGRGGLYWSDGAFRVSFHTITDFEKTPPTSDTAPAESPSPGRWEGDGRGDRGGTGVRFRAAGSRWACFAPTP